MRAAFEQIQTDPANAVYVNQRTSYDVPPSQPQYGAPPPSYSAPPNAYGGPQVKFILICSIKYNLM